MIRQDSSDTLSHIPDDIPHRLAPRNLLWWTVSTAVICSVLGSITFFAGIQLYDWAYAMGRTSIPTLQAVEPPASLHRTGETGNPVPQAMTAVANPDRELVDDSSAPAKPPVYIQLESPARLNILMLGVDARPDDTSLPRTDTIMVMSLDWAAGTVDLLSIPRDLWVPVPGFAPTKVNLVYSIGERFHDGGGEELLRDTIARFINQPIHNYVWVNFDGFVQFVDQIGGIDLYVPQAIRDEKYPTTDYGVETFELEAGYQHLDGTTALKYARTRSQDGDYTRSSRQQIVIEAILQKATNPAHSGDLLLAAPEIFRTLLGNFASDLSLPQMIQLAKEVLVQPPTLGTTLVLDSRLGTEGFSDEGMWVLIPDRRKIREVLGQFFQVSATVIPTAGS